MIQQPNKNFFCKLDFNRWNNSEIIISNEDNKVSLRNDFLSVSISQNKKSKQFYLYDRELNILIFYRGIVLCESSNNFLKSILIDYLRNDKTFAKRLNGFFSLVLIDFKKRKGLSVSDKTGLLKLFYSFNKNILLLSNNISELVTDETSISKEGLAQYILINYYTDDKTIYNVINKTQAGSIIFFEMNENPYENKYFDLLNHLTNLKDEKLSLKNVASSLKDIVHEYSEGNSEIITLTSGLDSRLLLSAVLSLNSKADAFTFGVNGNLEFDIASLLATDINNSGEKIINHKKICLEEEFEEFVPSYLDYIRASKNIELNFNRYHYVFVWNKLRESFTENRNILTGLCGDSFLRNGLSSDFQTNELFFNLINTTNKAETIKKFLDKNEGIINETGLNKSFCNEYLNNLLSEFKENDKYFNHFIVKIKFSINNYFGSEVNTENSLMPTYPVFLDTRYLDNLIRSGYSIFTNKFLDQPNRYKLKSHRFYYELISSLYNQLNYFPTNRGFPPKYSSSYIYLPLKTIASIKMKRKSYILDLNYDKWRSLLKTDIKNVFKFETEMKLKVLSAIN